MALEEKIDVKEYDPKCHTAVTRMSCQGRTALGRPVGVVNEEAYFPTIDAAQEWIAAGREHYHLVWIPFPRKRFSAWLRRSLTGEDLVLESSGHKGISPRSIADHHGAMVDDDNGVMDIIVRIGTIEDKVLERGCAWIPAQDANAPLYFVLNPNKYTIQDLKNAFSRITQRSKQVLRDLLKGYTPPTQNLGQSSRHSQLN